MRIGMTALLLVLLVVSVAGANQAEPVEVPAGYGVLTGQVMMGDKPLPQATIAIFKVDSGPAPDLGSSRRVPEEMARAEGGRFRIDLPPGRYYLGVVARLDPERKGPPSQDEKFFFARDEKGELRKFEVNAGKAVDLGVLSGSAPENFPEIANAFTVRGTVYDDQGKPRRGVLVLVRQDMKVPRPLFISPPTGADGSYQLKLPAGQFYYLVVRESLVDIGRPVVGTNVGVYVSDSASAAARSPMLSDGDPITGSVDQVLTGMDITMRLIRDPDEVQVEIQKQAELPMSREEEEKMPLPGSDER